MSDESFIPTGLPRIKVDHGSTVTDCQTESPPIPFNRHTFPHGRSSPGLGTNSPHAHHSPQLCQQATPLGQHATPLGQHAAPTGQPNTYRNQYQNQLATPPTHAYAIPLSQSVPPLLQPSHSAVDARITSHNQQQQPLERTQSPFVNPYAPYAPYAPPISPIPLAYQASPHPSLPHPRQVPTHSPLPHSHQTRPHSPVPHSHQAPPISSHHHGHQATPISSNFDNTRLLAGSHAQRSRSPSLPSIPRRRFKVVT